MSDVCDAADEDVTAVGLHTTLSSQPTQRQTQETHHLGFNCIVGFHFSRKWKESVLYYYINCTFHCLLQAKSWLDSWEGVRGGGGGFVVVVVVAAQRAALYYIYSRRREARRAGPSATPGTMAGQDTAGHHHGPWQAGACLPLAIWPSLGRRAEQSCCRHCLKHPRRCLGVGATQPGRERRGLPLYLSI